MSGEWEIIRDLGFPVFVALYFMVRLERRMDRSIELLNNLMMATAIIGRSVDNVEENSRQAVPGPVSADASRPFVASHSVEPEGENDA